jgi:hypothetical protein
MATTTPNFGWPVPTSTDLVKDGATAIEALGDAIDASMVDLEGGTTGQILAKNSNTDMDFVWTTPNPGDITAVTAGTGLTGGGTSGAVTLSLDSAAVTGPAFRAYRGTSSQSFSANTWSKAQLNAETFDTASCFDSTTNYRFTPNKAGYYQFNAAPNIQRSGTGLLYGAIYKNGSGVSVTGFNIGSADTFSPVLMDIIYMNGTTDYVEMYVYDQAATSRTIVYSTVGDISYFSGTWIRS